MSRITHKPYSANETHEAIWQSNSLSLAGYLMGAKTSKQEQEIEVSATGLFFSKEKKTSATTEEWENWSFEKVKLAK